MNRHVKIKGTMRKMGAECEVLSILRKHGVDTVAVLPCDRIRRLIWLLERDESFDKIHLLKEEDGVGVCAGISLCGGRPAMLIQSSGLGNAFNAILSLSMFYGLPLPVIASWRGIYKEKIPAQIPFNENLPAVLDAFKIPFRVMRHADDIEMLDEVLNYSFDHEVPFVLLISPEFWEQSNELEQNAEQDYFSARPSQRKWKRVLIPQRDEFVKPEMMRYDAIRIIASFLSDEVVVSNIGVPSKELFASRDRALNFYMLGSYSQVSCIGLGISLRTRRDVFVLEGDGSMLATSIYPVIAEKNPDNLTIFCLDNGTFGSTGDQPTHALSAVDLEIVARSFGIENTKKVKSASELTRVMETIHSEKGAKFVHIVLKPGNADVKNIPLKHYEIKERFKAAVKEK